MHLLASDKDGNRRELEIEELWPHKELLVLKFAGIDSISAAESLVGCELRVSREQRAELGPEWTYISDLFGCVVFDTDLEVGTIKDVQFGAGEAPLLIVRSETKRYEIPFAKAYLKRIDLTRKRIEMSLPEGLLDVNAPLTEEEKQQQRGPNRKK